MTLPELDRAYLQKFLTELLNTPSPTGFTHLAMDYIRRAWSEFPEVELIEIRKGALVGVLPGETDAAPCALTAHVDTLGAMVKEIKDNGRLKLSRLGGLVWPSVETEGCTVFTRRKGTLRGSLMLTHASVHVFPKEAAEDLRNDETLEVRLDAITDSKDETRLLGVEVGDFVAFDPRVEVTNGFVRGRFLDDKASVACMAGALHAMHAAGLRPRRKTYLHVSNYEEVGHGASAGIPSEVSELIAVDMAAVGIGQNSDEFHASLCVKDAGGPYHHGLSQRLRDLAEEHLIPYKVDIYPYYGSDGEAFWRAGGDVAVALIGPGVDASHNYERTHMDALSATTNWILAYLLS